MNLRPRLARTITSLAFWPLTMLLLITSFLPFCPRSWRLPIGRAYDFHSDVLMAWPLLSEMIGLFKGLLLSMLAWLTYMIAWGLNRFLSAHNAPIKTLQAFYGRLICPAQHLYPAYQGQLADAIRAYFHAYQKPYQVSAFFLPYQERRLEICTLTHPHRQHRPTLHLLMPNPNAKTCRQRLAEITAWLDTLTEYYHVRLTVFDYPGTAGQASSSVTASSLIDSVIACCRALKIPKNEALVLYGHSLGGGIAIRAAKTLIKEHKRLWVIHDRSFSRLSRAASYQLIPTGPWHWGRRLFEKTAHAILKNIDWEIDAEDALAHLPAQQVCLSYLQGFWKKDCAHHDPIILSGASLAHDHRYQSQRLALCYDQRFVRQALRHKTLHPHEKYNFTPSYPWHKRRLGAEAYEDWRCQDSQAYPYQNYQQPMILNHTAHGCMVKELCTLDRKHSGLEAIARWIKHHLASHHPHVKSA